MANLACPSVDINFLSPNGFILMIERLPNVTFFAQSVEIPAVTLPALDQPTPLSIIEIPSDRMNFAPLQITFAVDERMSNWIEVFKWIQALGFPEEYEQYRIGNNREIAPQELPANYSDAALIVLSSHNNPVRKISFKDCFPTSLGGIRFSTTNTDVPYVVCDLTLEYSYYTIE